MATSYTSLLGLALPVTGELTGTWGDTVNNSITSLLDTAVAGSTTLSTDADVTLTTTTGASNQARQMILLCTGARTALRTITAPAQSKVYVVVNSTTGGYGVKIVGSGPTTGVTIANGKTALLAWNGSDFVEVSPATASTATNLAGGAAGSVPYQTGAGATTFLSIGTANRVLTSTGSAPQWTNQLLSLGQIQGANISGTSMTVHPSVYGQISSYDSYVGNTSTALVGMGLTGSGSGSTTLAKIDFVSSGSTQRAGILCAEDSSGNAAYLALYTQNAGGTFAERMRLSGAGNVGIGRTPTYQLDVASTARFNSTIGVGNTAPSASGAGISFPATQSASSDANTLDDYEEGTWTPTIQGTATAGTVTYATRLGKYTKVGNVVTYQCSIDWSAGTGTGNLRVTGLPFADAGGSYLCPATILPINVVLPANSVAVAFPASGQTYISISSYPVGGGADAAVAYDAAGVLYISGIYFAA